MSYIDQKYINLCTSRVEKFKKVRDNLWNFRCPVCGDSHKRKDKARGYIYKKKNSFFYKCHNCGAGHTFNNFLKSLDPRLHSEYLVEKYKNNETQKNIPIPDKAPFVFEKPKFQDPLSKLHRFDKIQDHPAFAYIKQRKIPEKHWDKLYLADKFYEWSRTMFPEKFQSINIDYPRLVIPFFDKSGKMFAYQGRAFGNEQPRYITLKLEENKEKIYGLERIDFDSHVYVVEGPLDSLFLDNCLAVAGADLDLINSEPSTTTAIYDNEPRNRHTIDRMFKSVDKGYNVVVWPSDLDHKDINDMVLAGYHDIQGFIKARTFGGLQAYLKINEWKRT